MGRGLSSPYTYMAALGHMNRTSLAELLEHHLLELNLEEAPPNNFLSRIDYVWARRSEHFFVYRLANPKELVHRA